MFFLSLLLPCLFCPEFVLLHTHFKSSLAVWLRHAGMCSLRRLKLPHFWNHTLVYNLCYFKSKHLWIPTFHWIYLHIFSLLWGLFIRSFVLRLWFWLSFCLSWRPRSSHHRVLGFYSVIGSFFFIWWSLEFPTCLYVHILAPQSSFSPSVCRHGDSNGLLL